MYRLSSHRYRSNGNGNGNGNGAAPSAAAGAAIAQRERDPRHLRLAICTMAKSEDDYLYEWVDYHYRLGFDEIHVLQHGDWRYHGPLHPALRLGTMPKEMRQGPAMDGWLRQHHGDFDWAVFIDVDEYIVLANGDNYMPTFLSRYSHAGAVRLNWRLFGTSGLEDNGDRRTVARFTRCSQTLSLVTKLAINLAYWNDNTVLRTVHDIFGIDNVINVNGDPAPTRDDPGTGMPQRMNIAYINHYYTRTPQEYRRKLERASGYQFAPRYVQWRLDNYLPRAAEKWSADECLLALNFQRTGKFIA